MNPASEDSTDAADETPQTSPDPGEHFELEGGDEGSLPVDSPSGAINMAKNNRSLAEFHRWYQKGKLIVDPEWQRRYVWDTKRASRLIESFLIDLPIPVVYLAGTEEGKYEVIDGLQRLTSVFDYFENKYVLSDLEIERGLNGKTFSQLEGNLQNKLEDATLTTFELARTTPKDLMFLIFERLNTGGMALNDMEIRNCLYRGGLNNLLKDLAENTDFKTCISQAGIEKRLTDRTLVLRFLAFYERTYTKARKGLKSFFNEFFQTYRNPTPDKIKEFTDAFNKSMRACRTIFGDKAFRLRRHNERGGGEWTPRINASILQTIAVSFTDYDIGQLTRAADRIFEAYISLLAEDDRWVQAVTAATGDYNKIEYTFETWKARLKEAIGTEQPNDKKRVFSRALKEEMFAADPTCSICGQRIVLVNDAALDHIVHYWRGGQTVPENARLAHRLCNEKREK